MDHFGIGSGVAGAVNVYFRSARRSGRTSSLVDRLKDGDRVVFTQEQEGRRVQRLCKERGVNIEIIVSDPKNPSRLFGRGSPHGTERTIFDHGWVEDFYLNAIKCAQQEIDNFQRELSGKGEAHLGTRRQAEEHAKWQY